MWVIVEIGFAPKLSPNSVHLHCSAFCRETQPTGIHTYIEKVSNQGLAHVITEAEKSHNLFSTNWRPRKANGVALVPVWRPENHEYQCLCPCLKAGDDGCLSASREQSAFLPPLCSIQAVNGLSVPTHAGDSNLHSAYWSTCQSPLQTSSQTLPEMCYQPSGHPLAQLRWHIKLTITAVQQHSRAGWGSNVRPTEAAGHSRYSKIKMASLLPTKAALEHRA